MIRVGEQKRSSFRMRVVWPVTLVTAKGTMEAETKNISREGAHIRCSQPLQLNEPVQMTIKAPDSNPLKVVAAVLWTDFEDESKQLWIIGFNFTEISAQDRQFLEQKTLTEFRDKVVNPRITAP